MNVSIHLSDEAQSAVRDAIVGPLVAYNTQQTGSNDYRGRTAFGWLFVELLFVPDRLRGRGMGANLMSRAEAEAVSRGGHGAWLDTFEFQARGFYEGLGYSCFGKLNDYPPGFARYFMKKALSK